MSDAHDQVELREWQESLRDVLALSGPDQARNILTALQAEAHKAGLSFEHPLNTPYINTIPPEKQHPFPGSREVERRIKSIVRWNAMAMVTRANKALEGLKKPEEFLTELLQNIAAKTLPDPREN